MEDISVCPESAPNLFLGEKRADGFSSGRAYDLNPPMVCRVPYPGRTPGEAVDRLSCTPP